MPGVAFAQPPDHLIPDITASIARAVATLPKDKTIALVGIATEAGGNAAIVARVNNTWAVQVWVGKTWRRPLTYGAEVMWSR